MSSPTTDELDAIREALGLLNSMILSGEQHSEKSEQVLKYAYEILDNMEHNARFDF